MSRLAPPGWLPWAILGLTVVAIVPAYGLMVLNAQDDPLMQAFYGTVFLGYGLIGAIVASRRPDNLMGWILLGVSSFTGLGFFGEQYGRYTQITAPGVLPAIDPVAWLGTWLWGPGIGLLIFGLLVFPNGSLPSRRWRPVAWLAGLVLAGLTGLFAFAPTSEADAALRNPYAVLPEGSVPVLETIFGIGILIVALVSLAAPILRFRRARGIERQQLKWFLYAGALLVAALALEPLVEPIELLAPFAWLTFPLALAAMPIAIGLAILRHGLYEIDRIIRRTIGYALVSAVLVGVYALAVLALTQVSMPITGGENVAVAASTLAVVALFRPVSRRIQVAVDHRFYRSRYDAQRTLEAFRASLRDEVDLERVTDQLASAVSSTLQPASASIWLRREAVDR